MVVSCDLSKDEQLLYVTDYLIWA